MNQLELANLLTTKPQQWKTSMLRGENKSVRWVPIIDVTGKNFYLGLTEEGYWVANSRDQLLKLGQNGFFVPLLPVLEQNYEKFLTHFKVSLKKVGLPISIVSFFPWLETIICGLEQGSDYWAALALKWLESCQELQTIEIESVLNKVSKAKWASQKVRQRSKRLKFAISKSLDKKDDSLFQKTNKMLMITTDSWHLFLEGTNNRNAYSHSFLELQTKPSVDLKNSTIKPISSNIVSFKSDRRIQIYNR